MLAGTCVGCLGGGPPPAPRRARTSKRLDADRQPRRGNHPSCQQASDSVVRWTGTFDDEPWDSGWGFNWGDVGDPPRARPVTIDGVSRHGRMLEVEFNVDSVTDRGAVEAKYGVNMLGAFSLMGLEPMEEAWFRYYVYLPDDWEAARDGKMPGLAGNLDVLDTPESTSGGGQWNPRSWSGRVMWNNETDDQRPSRPNPRTYLYVTSFGGVEMDAHRDPGQRSHLRLRGSVDDRSEAIPPSCDLASGT